MSVIFIRLSIKNCIRSTHESTACSQVAKRCRPVVFGSTGKERVLDVCPEKVHQRVPLFIGSKKEVEYAESFLKRESS